MPPCHPGQQHSSDRTGHKTLLCQTQKKTSVIHTRHPYLKPPLPALRSWCMPPPFACLSSFCHRPLTVFCPLCPSSTGAFQPGLMLTHCPAGPKSGPLLGSLTHTLTLPLLVPSAPNTHTLCRHTRPILRWNAGQRFSRR